MPLPASAGALGSNSRRSRRTPSIDSNAPAAGSLGAAAALVACTSIVPGVPSGNRTIRHRTPPTLRRPSTANRSPHNGCCPAVTVTSPGNNGRNSCSLCSWSSPGARRDVQRRGMVLPADGARAGAAELRAGTADPRATRPDPLSQGARSRNAPARCSGCTRPCRTPGSSCRSVATDILGVSGPQDARRADLRDATTRRSWPTSRRARCARRCPRCARRSKAASPVTTPS